MRRRVISIGWSSNTRPVQAVYAVQFFLFSFNIPGVSY